MSALSLFRILVVFLSISPGGYAGLSCQGSSYTDALTNCPDSGSQQYSAGGFLVVRCVKAFNLPNLDSTGPASGVSDPFVQFTFGEGQSSHSSVIRNELNPVWNEDIRLGYVTSATELLIEIWDYDVGLEFSNDLIGSHLVRVPFCSTFTATAHTVDCGKPFGCSSDESLWASPVRKVCNETTWINFSPGADPFDDGPCAGWDNGTQTSQPVACLLIETKMIPFTMDIDLLYSNAITQVPQLSVLGNQYAAAPWTLDASANNLKGAGFGVLYTDDSTKRANLSYPGSEYIRGALMWRFAQSDRYIGPPGTLSFYFSVNFPAYIYVCRDIVDDFKSIPNWLVSYDRSNLTTTRINFSNKYLECFFQISEGTVKNKYGGIVSGELSMHVNSVLNKTGISAASYYNNMYTVLALPRFTHSAPVNFTITYTSIRFIYTILLFGLISIWFTYLIYTFLEKIDYRISSITPYLLNLTMVGKEKNMLAQLFMVNGDELHLRSRMFHAKNSILMLILFPPFLFLSWGFSCSKIASPETLGMMIAWLGMGGCFLGYGMKLWKSQNWRMTPTILIALGLSVFFCLAFIVSVVFADPFVILHGSHVNFPSLSLIFGTINCVPLIFLIFKNDKKHREHLKKIVEKLSQSAIELSDAKAKNKLSKAGVFSINHSLHVLLGNSYSINPKVPILKLGSVMRDDQDVDKSTNGSFFLYYSSIITLFVYLMLAIVKTPFPSVAFLNCLSLFFLDYLHNCFEEGANWTPAYKILLLCLGRIFIMTSDGRTWLLNYSAAYLLYGLFCVNEIVSSRFPMITNTQAGEIAFSGKDISMKSSLDLGGSPYFCLSFLTYSFIAVILVAIYGDLKVLPVVQVNMVGTYWSTPVFGLFAILLVVNIGLIVAAGRASYLKKRGLLKGYEKAGFFWSKNIDIPLFFSVAAEVSVMSSGLIISAVTGSFAILVFGVFIPPISGLFLHAYSVWVKNDYELVKWPPNDVVEDEPFETASELEVAFDMIKNLFGNDEEAHPETKDDNSSVDQSRGVHSVASSFKLPGFDVPKGKNDVPLKMPPLPLKSILRKKTIKTEDKPKGMNSSMSIGNSSIGSAATTAATNDLWFQFDEKQVTEEENEPLITNSVKPKVIRRSIWKHPYILAVQDAILSSPIGRVLGRFSKKYAKAYADRRRAYQRVDPEIADVNEDISNSHNNNVEEDTIDDIVVAQIAPKVSIEDMSLLYAFFNGYLLIPEYMALLSWFGGLALIIIMGCILSVLIVPSWLGHVIWCSLIILVCTISPMVRYFNTYVIDETIKYFGIFLMAFHLAFCLSVFVVTLKADTGLTGSLWILDYFFYFPVGVYMFVEFYGWVDNNFCIEKIDFGLDRGKMNFVEVLSYFKAHSVIILFTAILIWEYFVWISDLVGVIVLLLLLTVIVGYVFVRDWALNDFWMSPEMSRIGENIILLIIFITGLISLFSANNPALPLSVFFVTIIGRLSFSIASKVVLKSRDTIYFFSPFVLPVYSYDAKTNDVFDEAPLVLDIFYLIVCMITWSCALSIFVHPVSIGVTLGCFFLLLLSVLISMSVFYIPEWLGSISSLTTLESVREATYLAKSKFLERRTPLNLEMSDWFGDSDEGPQAKHLSRVETMKKSHTLENALCMIQEVRSLSYVPGNTVSADETISMIDIPEEKSEGRPSWFRKYLNFFGDFFDQSFKVIPSTHLKGYEKHNNRPFSFDDAIPEALIVGRGPMGFLGLNGYLYRTLLQLKGNPRLKFLEFSWLDNYNDNGTKKGGTQFMGKLDYPYIFGNISDCEKAIDFCYFEEIRCAIHFICLLLAAGQAKMERETVLFQKFLRENRFRLASNGISPPSDVFSNTSYTTIDMPLVAIWLSTLTLEERERFSMLKSTFSEEQALKDAKVDEEDSKMLAEAEKLKEERVSRENDMLARSKRNSDLELSRRVHAFAESLEEPQRILEKMNVWLENADSYVDSKDEELYAKFKTSCLPGDDAVTTFAQHALARLEAALQDCRFGEYGRQYQFVDPEFNPGDKSLGITTKASIKGWRCAPGINEFCNLFDGKADAEDVENGILNDQWLLSAICMISSGGGSEYDDMTDALRKVFIGRVTPDDQVLYDTKVGAYCVRLFKRGVWIPILVDDIFPMLQHSEWTDENKGIAVAHSKGCRVLWVSVIEKAFAKFYGSYAEIERGFVHHALQDLTGCDSECICLNHASRGVGKLILWEKILRYMSNGFILGAGTGSRELADKDIKEMGIVFEAAYTIYDVRYIDGYRLLKLRNPPGDHEEWKGDWSDKSALWNKRLKVKLGWADVDDNTFWMSFDDFCNVYRYLYVCHWSSYKWKTVRIPGIWKQSIELEQDNKDMLKGIIQKARNELVDDSIERRKREKSRVNTSGGLPTRHNPSCILENNPHFALTIYRPTDIRITVSQTDSRGVACTKDLVPFAIYLCKNEHPTEPMRIKYLTPSDVILHSGAPKKEMSQHIYGSLNPGLYMIIVPCYVAGLEGNFITTLSSNYRADFISIWPPSWMMKKIELKLSTNPTSTIDRVFNGGIQGLRLEDDEEANFIDKVQDNPDVNSVNNINEDHD